MTTSDPHAAPTAPPNQQLLFDWTQDENIQTSPPVGPDSSHATETPRAIEPADHPCPPISVNSVAASNDAASPDDRRYPPNHPWHYTREGDNAPPVPFDDIPPSEDYGRSLERDLPKPAAKRIIKARELLQTERRDLEQARTRYEDVIARGAEALSRYDREIAYGGNDDMARAGTLALLFNQIAWRKGRIAYLEQLQASPLARVR